MRHAQLLSVVVLTLLPSLAWAQGNPLGPEFRVNTYTTQYQGQMAVASDSSGNFVVVWVSYGQDGSAFGVVSQRYASAGTPLGPEFRVNTYTTNTQRFPSVAADSSGNFVVVWDSAGEDGSSYGVFGQRHASSGAPLGSEFRVNTYTTLQQGYPSVAAASTGNFVVVWSSNGPDGDQYGVFGQRYASSGAPVGAEFRVNTYTTGNQARVSVAADSSGNFVVVWVSYDQDGSSTGVFGQRFASAGAPVGPEFRVNTFTIGSQTFPSVAADLAGNFVAVWRSDDGSGEGVFGQRYASSGVPQGPEFRVNTYLTGYQGVPSIASDASGNFVVVWTGDLQDGSSSGIFGQRYASIGAPLGPEFRINTYTSGEQSLPAVGSDAAGNFVVVWRSYGQDGSHHGVFGQRYSQIVPVELMHFRVE